MADVRKILKSAAGLLGDERGVSSAEYAILAVGVIVMVGGAISAFNLLNPMSYAASSLTSGQAALISSR